VLGEGRVMWTPAGVEEMGHAVRSWLMRDCAQSLAVALRSAGVWFKGRGFASFKSRFPRSKVYGIGLVTMTELFFY